MGINQLTGTGSVFPLLSFRFAPLVQPSILLALAGKLGVDPLARFLAPCRLLGAQRLVFLALMLLPARIRVPLLSLLGGDQPRFQ